ncbi:hypothetical protein ABZV34_17740 [Streptomyces sp. NPDC005195]|uniref:hypothetical protein n=1 Tax=Streptomyces sp. NPDC005195 TaxID=3154561 RepID=UPI0033B49419
MGVFARLLRRSKAAEEASIAEVPDGTLTAEAGAETGAGTDADVTTTDAEVTTGAEGIADAGADATADAGGAAEPVPEPVAEEATGSSESENAGKYGRKAEPARAATGAAPSEDVEIPQQQTAEKAADNGAGESARK